MTSRLLIPCIAALMVIATVPADAQQLLNDANLSPALILPPPPVDGSPLALEELRQLHAIDAARTPAEIAHAEADDHRKDVSIFADAMGPGFDLARLPETTKLFDIVRAEEKAAADRAKAFFKRNRPWIVDRTLHPCSTDDAPQSSYPSGHTTMGFAMGSILSHLAPDKSAAVMARASDYAHSRLVCEMHFPADVTAGAIWGTMIAERLMQLPVFQAQFGRAGNELRAKGW